MSRLPRFDITPDGTFEWHVASNIAGNQAKDSLPGDPLQAARTSDPPTSKRAAKMNSKGRLSQANKLLLVFDEALPVNHSGIIHEIALNAFEASAIAKLPPHSCWWKRVSDLKSQGLIQRIGTNYDTITHAERETYVITDEGRKLAAQIRENKA